ncbi:MAG TPA: hypothetical protein VFN71_15855 [Methylomirabilota bacterium]|nr:hypothetical protein [Methylomirabilota bacterium]
MANRRATVGAVFAASALALAGAAPAAAEELREQLNVPMILNLLSRPPARPEAALVDAVKRDAATPAPANVRPDGGEVLPDGSVRYGRGNASLTISVRNPCPPGDLEHEMQYLRSLPGRGRK